MDRRVRARVAVSKVKIDHSGWEIGGLGTS